MSKLGRDVKKKRKVRRIIGAGQVRGWRLDRIVGLL